MKPGIYPGLPMEAYLALPAVSASIVKTALDRCPRAAWYESWLNPAYVSDNNAATDTGTIAHEILLEGTQNKVAVIDPADHPAEKTGAIPDGWTNKSIKAARDYAREQGKIPVLKKDMVEINAMVDSARAFIESLKASEPAVWAAFQPTGGDSEITAIWEDAGTLCRMRPDRISADRKLIVDVKTTARSAEPNSWGRTQMVGLSYYVSAAFYRRGCEATFKTRPDYLFLVIETTAPYLCSLVGVDPHGFELGAQKVEAGLNIWRTCVERNSWPAYPARACYPEIPSWEDARWEERQEQEIAAGGIAYKPEQIWGKP